MSSLASAERLTIEQAPAQTSMALRNLGLTSALTITTLAIFGLAWGTTDYEMLIVSMGWPNIILGFLFYFGRVLRGKWHARPSFLFSRCLHSFSGPRITLIRSRVSSPSIITDPRPQHYRQDLRRVELSEAQFSASDWTLIRFAPISYSHGKDFYFYMRAARAEGTGAKYNTLATIEDTRGDGEIRISDRKWDRAHDLVFKPYYSSDARVNQEEIPIPDRTIHIELTGRFPVGQIFTAERDDLAGI